MWERVNASKCNYKIFNDELYSTFVNGTQVTHPSKTQMPYSVNFNYATTEAKKSHIVTNIMTNTSKL